MKTFLFDELSESSKKVAINNYCNSNQHIDGLFFNYAGKSLKRFFEVFSEYFTLHDYSIDPFDHSYISVSWKHHSHDYGVYNSSFLHRKLYDLFCDLTTIKRQYYKNNKTRISKISKKTRLEFLTGEFTDYTLYDSLNDFLHNPNVFHLDYEDAVNLLCKTIAEKLQQTARSYYDDQYISYILIDSDLKFYENGENTIE